VYISVLVEVGKVRNESRDCAHEAGSGIPIPCIAIPRISVARVLQSTSFCREILKASACTVAPQNSDQIHSFRFLKRQPLSSRFTIGTRSSSNGQNLPGWSSALALAAEEKFVSTLPHKQIILVVYHITPVVRRDKVVDEDIG
jgi:hypothetical protein